MSTQGVDTTEIEQVFSLLNVVIEQNYFEHQNTFFKQLQGLAMGAQSNTYNFVITTYNCIFSICR
jgi:hypothetical protein